MNEQIRLALDACFYLLNRNAQVFDGEVRLPFETTGAALAALTMARMELNAARATVEQ